MLPREAVELRDVMIRNHRRVELNLYPNRGHGDTVASFAPVAHWRTPALRDTIAFIDSVVGVRGQ